MEEMDCTIKFCTLILAGGYGTRLGETGERVSKPLLRIGSKTIIDHIIDKVPLANKTNRIFVLVNQRSLNQYEQWLTHHPLRDRITLVNNQKASESSCPDIVTNIILTLQRHMIGSDLLLVGGDNLFDFQLHDFVSFGKRKGVSTVVVDIKSRDGAQRFSVVTLSNDGRIGSLREKPENPETTLITTCIYWFPAYALHAFVEYKESSDLPTESLGQFMEWLTGRLPVFGYLASGAWYDVGTPDTHRFLQQFGLQHK